MVTIQTRQLAGPVTFQQGTNDDTRPNVGVIVAALLAGTALMTAIYFASKGVPVKARRRGRGRGRRR